MMMILTRVLVFAIALVSVTAALTIFIYTDIVHSPSLGAIGWDTCSVVTVRIPETSPPVLVTAAGKAVSDWNNAGSPVLLSLRQEPLTNDEVTNPPDGTISVNIVDVLPAGTDSRALALATPIADPLYQHIVSGYILLLPEATKKPFFADIVEHEIGHILGLGHEPHGVMNPIMMGDAEAENSDTTFIKTVTPPCLPR